MYPLGPAGCVRLGLVNSGGPRRTGAEIRRLRLVGLAWPAPLLKAGRLPAEGLLDPASHPQLLPVEALHVDLVVLLIAATFIGIGQLITCDQILTG